MEESFILPVVREDIRFSDAETLFSSLGVGHSDGVNGICPGKDVYCGVA